MHKCTDIERNIKILKSDYLQVVQLCILFSPYMIVSFPFFFNIACITVIKTVLIYNLKIKI